MRVRSSLPELQFTPIAQLTILQLERNGSFVNHAHLLPATEYAETSLFLHNIPSAHEITLRLTARDPHKRAVVVRCVRMSIIRSCANQ